jgi:glutathionyl-hydroquinone reductase
MMSAAFEGRRLKVGTGCSIIPKYWDKKREKVISSAANSIVINMSLNELSNKTVELYHSAITNGILPTPEYLKENIKNVNKHKKNAELTDNIPAFFSTFQDFIEIRSEDPAFGNRIIKH